jgi:hypothetical protein
MTATARRCGVLPSSGPWLVRSSSGVRVKQRSAWSVKPTWSIVSTLVRGMRRGRCPQRTRRGTATFGRRMSASDLVYARAMSPLRVDHTDTSPRAQVGAFSARSRCTTALVSCPHRDAPPAVAQPFFKTPFRRKASSRSAYVRLASGLGCPPPCGTSQYSSPCRSAERSVVMMPWA